MKPFLKWAGGKYRLAPKIAAALPSGQRLVEPFVGSGALWLNTDYPQALLTDINDDLINLYRTLKTEGLSFIDYCQTYFDGTHNTSAEFYRLRTAFNTSLDIRQKSALFVYLNRHCFNGLCRYNSQGIFNVPYGRYVKPHFPRVEMVAFWQKAQHAEFLATDFRQIMAMCQTGDVVYCDPPYAPMATAASFTDYATAGFGQQDQLDLAQLAAELAHQGVPVLISNHDTDFTRNIYRDAELQYFDVQRFISATPQNRKQVPELLALFKSKDHTVISQ